LKCKKYMSTLLVSLSELRIYDWSPGVTVIKLSSVSFGN
jgi:hypothetical protein